MTTNFELIDIEKKLNIKNKFLGVFMKDEIGSLKPVNDFWLICNLNDSDKNINGHWSLLWKKGKNKVYLSSFGDPIFNEAKQLLGDKILCTTFQIQEFGTSICGELCLLTAYLLDHDIPFEDIILEFVKIEK